MTAGKYAQNSNLWSPIKVIRAPSVPRDERKDVQTRTARSLVRDAPNHVRDIERTDDDKDEATALQDWLVHVVAHPGVLSQRIALIQRTAGAGRNP